MHNDSQKQILKAMLLCLRPIARVLLQCGIGFREFAEVSKMAFVDVATSDYGIRGRPTNMSRVAVMTGLTRKEVRRIRESRSIALDNIKNKTSPLMIILHKWVSESEFLRSNGEPAVLPFEGEFGSFKSLAKQFAGDIPPGAIRTELKRVGCVEENDDGSLKLVKRSYRAADFDQRVLNSLTHAVYPCLRNVAHNLDPEEDENTWPQFTAFAKSIRISDLPRIRRITNDRFSDFIESFDDLFMAYESLHEGDAKQGDENPIAVELVYFEEDEASIKSLW